MWGWFISRVHSPTSHDGQRKCQTDELLVAGSVLHIPAETIPSVCIVGGKIVSADLMEQSPMML